MSRTPASREGGGAVDFLEEAVHLLRRAPGSLAAYYLGSLPFVVGFLYFWTDMSRSAFAEERHGQEALAVGLLFLWMKTWHAVFAGLLHEQVTGHAGPRWTPGRCFRQASLQAMVQPSALFILPVAFLLTLPFGWTYAFYQNVTVLGGVKDTSSRELCRSAAHQAQLWPGQNHALLGMLAAFGFFVFLNVGLTLFQAPHLLKSLLGIETVFSQSGWSLLSTTFLMAALSITYLCVDPIVKAVYVLRCFHGEAIESGEDLRVALRRLRSAAQAALLAIVCWSAPVRAADGPPPAPTQGALAERSAAMRRVTGVPAQDLDRAIREVISQREYSWRLPRIPSEREQEPGLLGAFVDSVTETMRRWARATFRLARDILDWILEAIFDRFIQHRPEPSRGTGWISSLRLLLYGVLAAIACVLAVVLVRFWRRRPPRMERVLAQPVSSVPDLTDQEVAADQLPEQEWLQLARDLAERGELRLSLRALYLAGLAHLGSRELIRIARSKSNREYQRELSRRLPAQAALQSAFAELVSTFDRVWYGLNEVDLDALARYRALLERVTTC